MSDKTNEATKWIPVTDEARLKDGARVKCRIEGVQVDDARLSFEKFGGWHVCQNVKDGCECPDKRGYQFSWWFNMEGFGEVTDLMIAADDIAAASPDHPTTSDQLKRYHDALAYIASAKMSGAHCRDVALKALAEDAQ